MKQYIAAGVVVGLMGLSAMASPINITVDSGGSLLNTVGVATKAQYGQSNNNPVSNLAFLQAEIGDWNGATMTPPLGPPTLTGLLNLDKSFDFTKSGSTFSLSTASGIYDYAVFHFGAGQAGSSGGYWEALYLNGADISTLTFDVPVVNGKSVGGISSARFFMDPPVPDGGATVALLGLGLAGVELFRRKVHAPPTEA